MALIICDFSSEVLGITTSIFVILPENTTSQMDMKGSLDKLKYPTLYLLHGLSGDHTAWQRETSIERYVDSLGLAVVMPNAGRSFYTDMKHGFLYRIKRCVARGRFFCHIEKHVAQETSPFHAHKKRPRATHTLSKLIDSSVLIFFSSLKNWRRKMLNIN